MVKDVLVSSIKCSSLVVEDPSLCRPLLGLLFHHGVVLQLLESGTPGEPFETPSNPKKL